MCGEEEKGLEEYGCLTERGEELFHHHEIMNNNSLHLESLKVFIYAFY